MIELIQFPWSPFCIVQRRILEYAGTRFKIVNVPNTDRSLVWKLTRGRYYAVPIIKDGKTGRDLTASESNISSPVTATDVAGSEALSSDLNKLSESIAESVLGLTEGVGMVCTAECLGEE